MLSQIPHRYNYKTLTKTSLINNALSFSLSRSLSHTHTHTHTLTHTHSLVNNAPKKTVQINNALTKLSHKVPNVFRGVGSVRM